MILVSRFVVQIISFKLFENPNFALHSKRHKLIKRQTIFKLIVAFILVFISIVLGELSFRFLIFSASSPFKNLKKPEKYAKSSSDDYWKLTYLFDGKFKPPEHPHPLLGWVGFFDRETLVHNDDAQGDNRRRFLIYGDSYIMCAADSIQCFHEILNNDTAFSKNNFLRSKSNKILSGSSLCLPCVVALDATGEGTLEFEFLKECV